jgi:four helix bundle protein
MSTFRFQQLEIWKHSIEISIVLYQVANELHSKKLFRYAEQLRSATLSISNNIAEGSGSAFNRDFANFLNNAHRSISEVANILINLKIQQLISENETVALIDQLDHLSRRISLFRKSLIN